MVLRDVDNEANQPDFAPWRHRRIDFLELAEDARACYNYITAYAHACDYADQKHTG
jgi:hypothetical protein